MVTVTNPKPAAKGKAKGRPKGKAKAVVPSAEASPHAGDGQTLYQFAQNVIPRNRPREGPVLPVHQAVPSFDGEDAVWNDAVELNQSTEVQANPSWPIHKENRKQFNWVTRFNEDTLTTDPEKLVPLPRYQDSSKCDVCGLHCTLELYEFRCFKKKEFLSPQEQGSGVRMLDPHIAYISRECALALLGARNSASVIREWVRTELLDKPLDEEMEEKLALLRPTERQAALRELLRHVGFRGEGADGELEDPVVRAPATFQRLERSSDMGPLMTLRSAEDKLITLTPPEGVTMKEHVLKTLLSITWPDCTSRLNVMPDGKQSIKAMCLGCTKPRFQSHLTIASSTRRMPMLTQLLARFAAKELAAIDPSFRWTSIQCNMNYSAKFHVDKNNWGPSYIIALGMFVNGRLFIAEADGPDQILLDSHNKVPRGYCPGQVVSGRFINVREEWQSFDGRIGHMAEEYEGLRISLVFFTRREPVPENVARLLEGMDFRVPDSRWFEETKEPPPGAFVRAMKMPRRQEVVEEDDEDSDDEVEDGRLQFEGQPVKDLEYFTAALQAAQWSEALDVPLAVTSCGSGLAAGMVLKQLLPQSKVQAAVVGADAATCRLAQNFGAEQAFEDFDVLISGAPSTCHVKKKKGQEIQREHIFHATFQVWDLLPYFDLGDTELRIRSKLRGLNDDDRVSAKSFRAIKEHLKRDKPPLALLEIPDWHHCRALQDRAWEYISQNVLDAEHYHNKRASFALPAPLSGVRFMIFVVRKDVMSEEKLACCVRVAEHLLRQLPHRRVQDCLLPDDAPCFRKTVKPPVKASTESKEEQGAYTDRLKKESAGHWLLQDGYGKYLKPLNQVCKQGKDTSSILVDLSAPQRSKVLWSSEQLPNPCSAWHFNLDKHRFLSGIEEMLIRAYPCGEQLHRFLSDAELRHIAAETSSGSLLVLGAALAAMLATADWTSCEQGLAPESKGELGLSTLRCDVSSLALAEEDSIPPGECEKGEDQVLSERAVVCYSLLQRMKSGMKSDRNKGDPKSLPATVRTALKARGEELQEEAIEVQEPETLLRSSKEDVHDWEDRKRKLAHFYQEQFGSLSFESAMRWTFQAAIEAYEEPGRHLAEEIMKNGLHYMNECLSVDIHKDSHLRKHGMKLDKELRGFEKFREEFLGALESKIHAWKSWNDENDMDGIPQKFELFKTLSLVRDFLKGGERYTFANLTADSYVVDVMAPVARCDIWKAIWQLLQDLQKSWQQIQNSEKSEAFETAGGFHQFAVLLKKVDAEVTKMDKSVRQKVKKLIPALLLEPPKSLKKLKNFWGNSLQLAFRLQDTELQNKLEESLAAEISSRCSNLQNGLHSQEVRLFLRGIAAKLPRKDLGQRLIFTADLLEKLEGALENFEQRDEHQLAELLRELGDLTQPPFCQGDTIKNLHDQAIAKVKSKLKELQEKQQAAAEALQQQEQQQRFQEAQKRTVEAMQKLRAVINYQGGEPRLKEGPLDPLQELLLPLQEALAANAAHRSNARLQKLIQDAQAAAKHFCEAPAVEFRRREVLLQQKFPKCAVEVLHQVGLLQRLSELSSSLLDDFQFIPPGIKAKLLQCVKEQKFDSKNLEPWLDEEVYSTKMSTTFGLPYFFKNKFPDVTSWKWPVPEEKAAEDPFPRSIGGLERHEEDHARYISANSRPRWCSLCHRPCASHDHLELPHHDWKRQKWHSACQVLKQFREAVSQANLHESFMGFPQLAQEILSLWKFEALAVLTECLDWPTMEVFWTLIMEPWPSAVDELDEWLGNQLHIAELEEPDLLVYPIPPTPGEHFPLFPDSDLDVANLPAKLEPIHLLSQGLHLQEDGKVWCACCQIHVDSDDWSIRLHLDLSGQQVRKAAKKHQQWKQNWEFLYEDVLKRGWECEVNGLTLNGHGYSCRCGKKGEKWVDDLSSGRGHFSEKGHRDKHLPVASKVVRDRQRQRWEQVFDPACERYLERLKEEQLPRWQRHLAAEPEAAQASSGSGVRDEPELPVPGVDFPDLSGGVIQGKKCLCCGVDATPGHERSAQHVNWAQGSLTAFKLIQEHGHRLWRDGISLKAKKLVCKCQKEINWWDIHSWIGDHDHKHVLTKTHKKYVEPAPTEQFPWEEQRQQRWIASFGVPAVPASPVTSEELPSASFAAPNTPDAKRRRVEASAASASSPARSIARAKGYDLPTAADIRHNTEECQKRHYPTLSQPLCWGWQRFKKGAGGTKEAWAFCQACEVYVAVIAWNGGVEYRCEEQGYCPHLKTLLSSL